MPMNDFLTDVEQSYAAVEGPERQAVLRRVWATLVRGVMNSSEEAVKDLQSLDDANLLGTLAKEQLSKTKLPADRRARMRLKGVSRFNQLIAEKGGVYTVQEAADLLRTSEDAVKRGSQSDRKKYLAFTRSGELVFPTCQFTQAGVIPGIKEVWSCLPDNLATVEVIRFMLSRVDTNEPRSPLELLADGIDVEVVKAIARQYLEQGV